MSDLDYFRHLGDRLYPIAIGWLAWMAFTVDHFKYIDKDHAYINAVYFVLACFSFFMLIALVLTIKATVIREKGDLAVRCKEKSTYYLWAKYCMLMAFFPFLLAVLTMFLYEMDLEHPIHAIKVQLMHNAG